MIPHPNKSDLRVTGGFGDTRLSQIENSSSVSHRSQSLFDDDNQSLIHHSAIGRTSSVADKGKESSASPPSGEVPQVQQIRTNSRSIGSNHVDKKYTKLSEKEKKRKATIDIHK